jgi:hypothetical protein
MYVKRYQDLSEPWRSQLLELASQVHSLHVGCAPQKSPSEKKNGDV